MSNLREDGLQVFREMLPGVLPDGLITDAQPSPSGDRIAYLHAPCVAPRRAVLPLPGGRGPGRV